MSELSKRIRKELIERGLGPGTEAYEHARGALRWRYADKEEDRRRRRAQYRRDREAIRRRCHARIIRTRKSVEDCLSEIGDAGLTQFIVHKALLAELSGAGETKGGNLNASDTTTTSGQRETRSSRSNLPSERSQTQSPTSTVSSEVLSEATSSSMSLLDDSAKHLHSLMKGVTGPLHEDAVTLPDIDRVNAAANCAKQLYSIMRLKLDAIKLARDAQD